jgi:translation initiation factor IF-3
MFWYYFSRDYYYIHMRRKWHRSKPKEEEVKFVANEFIRSAEVFLIGDDGQPAGRMSLEQAKRLAQEAEMDLVLVNPKAEPPVAKIADIGQLKYETEKRLHKQKTAQKKIDTKEIRLSVRIGDHDYNVRLEQARRFLGDGDKIKVEVVQKGRERQHPETAIDMIKRFEQDVRSTEGLELEKEQPLTKMNGRFSIVLSNKK